MKIPAIVKGAGIAGEASGAILALDQVKVQKIQWHLSTATGGSNGSGPALNPSP
jgi:hypothetical protein